MADLGTPEGCEQAVAETEQRLGPVDILVCNHGLGCAHERLLWEQTPETWRQTMGINLDGPFYLSQRVMPGMVQRGCVRLCAPVQLRGWWRNIPVEPTTPRKPVFWG